MKNIKKGLSILLLIGVLLSISIPTFAAIEDTGFEDVSSEAWYAESAKYVRENNLMSGVSPSIFGPGAPMSRAMLATVLYRSAGSPDVTGDDGFADTASDAWYSNAVLWASNNNIISGYGNGLFGKDDTVSREQIAAILWRYDGSPSAEKETSGFNDASSISSWAVQAVNWAKEQGVLNGKNGNNFDPKANATRAEVATILRNYLTASDNKPSESISREVSKTLIVYFSMPEDVDTNGVDAISGASIVVNGEEVMGNTEYIAHIIQDTIGGDLFEIKTEQQYPLDHDPLVDQAADEKDDNARPALSTHIENLDQYDTIILGYPIWWSDLPMPLYTFLEEYNLSGKTIIPFCPHGGSGLSGTVSTIAEIQPNATVSQDGFTISRNKVADSEDVVTAWLKNLDILKQ